MWWRVRMDGMEEVEEEEELEEGKTMEGNYIKGKCEIREYLRWRTRMREKEVVVKLYLRDKTNDEMFPVMYGLADYLFMIVEKM